jgi:FAD/FMN-containing dehydrogenase
MADDALVLDLSKMTSVSVDAPNALVTVEGGCRLGDMDSACQEHGLAVVTGTNPDTGVVGLSIHGGAGYLSRQHGLAVDNFHSAELVLASGEVVVASRDNEHAELLWGISGGGSNFGVVTKLTMRAHPVGKVFGGMVINVALSTKTAATIVGNWRDWILSAPRSVGGAAVLPCGAPVVPMVIVETDKNAVPQRDGARTSISRVPSLRAALSGCGAFGACVSVKLFKTMHYHTEMQSLLESLQRSGHYFGASLIVPELSDEVVATLVHATRNDHPNSEAAVGIFPLNGAVSDAPLSSTAFHGGRGAISLQRPPRAFWIIVEAKFTPDEKGANRAKAVAWSKELYSRLRHFNISETAHTLDGNMEETMRGVGEIFGPNESRLRQVKAAYDPNNFFRCNRNIEPVKSK